MKAGSLRGTARIRASGFIPGSTRTSTMWHTRGGPIVKGQAHVIKVGVSSDRIFWLGLKIFATIVDIEVPPVALRPNIVFLQAIKAAVVKQDSFHQCGCCQTRSPVLHAFCWVSIGTPCKTCQSANPRQHVDPFKHSSYISPPVMIKVFSCI